MISRFAAPVLDLFFPKRCPLCDADLAQGFLCNICLAQCQPLANHSKAEALFVYDLALRDLILQAKYGHSLRHYEALGHVIDKALAQKIAALDQFSPQAISYVPTHWAKRVWRGLDLPSMFAEKIALRLKVPLLHALKRARLGHTQSNIEKKSMRLEAVSGLFKLNTDRKAQRLLVVDDITTTGATFDEAKKILHSMSRKVQCLAIAKTP